MTTHDIQEDVRELTHWESHRFFGLVVCVIVIAIFLVSVALSLYQSSGAAQLDLSRPGYSDVRKEAAQGESTVSYPANGTLDERSLADFRKLYGDRMNRATATRSFDPAAMSDDSLQMYDKLDSAADPQAAATQ